jgi:hypothetical protein
MNKITLKLSGLSFVLSFLLLSGLAYAIVDDHQITIHTVADITNKQQSLINFVWGAGGFPSGKLPSSVTLNVPSPVGGLNNLLRVDQLLIGMDAGQQGLAYHFIPARQNSRLVIVHHGHACTFDDDPSLSDIGYGMQRTINGLLTDGYSVLAVYMPHMRPDDCGTVSHDSLFTDPQYAPSSGSPMKYFLEPVAVSLNYLKTRSAADGFPSYQDFSMVGLSGGGWTTTVYAAIDPTIKFSIPVAGTMPLYNRAGASYGDTEQLLDAFYQIAGYPDLYVLGSFGQGRKQVWLLNRRDNCCFGDRPDLYQDPIMGRTWEQVVRDYEYQVRITLANLGGPVGFFRLEIDEAAPSHMISWNAVVNQILSELNGGRRYIGASSSSHAYVRGLNGHLWHNLPAGWEDTGCPMVGVVAALEGAVNSLDVFYRDGGNRLMHAFTNGFGWTCQPAGGVIISDPAVVSSGAGTFDIVAFGGDYKLYHWYWTGGGISPFEQVNGGTSGLGTPSLVTRGPNQLDVFFRSFDRSLYHIHSTGPVPWPSEFLGGIMLDFPSAVAAPDGSLRGYVRGQSSRLWEAAQFNGGPWQWSSISDLIGGQLIAGSPSASVQGNAVRVHARQPAINLSTFTFAGAWSFANNGGGITGSPTSTPGGAWARGQSAGLWLNDGANWLARGGLFD